MKTLQEENADHKAETLEREREFEAAVQQQAKTNGNQNGHVPNGMVKVEGIDNVDGGGILGSDVDEDVDME